MRLAPAQREKLLAAVLGAYGLFADGVEWAEVVLVASDARQAGIIHRQVARMVEPEPRLSEQTQVFQNRLYVPHHRLDADGAARGAGGVAGGGTRASRSSTSYTW